MLSQKIFIKLMKWKGWIPIGTNKGLFSLSGVKYYLTFKDHETFECLCSPENRDKILNLKGNNNVS